MNRTPNLFTYAGLKEFVDATPTLRGLMIYTDSDPPFTEMAFQVLKERMESRGGWFLAIEGG